MRILDRILGRASDVEELEMPKTSAKPKMPATKKPASKTASTKKPTTSAKKATPAKSTKPKPKVDKK